MLADKQVHPLAPLPVLAESHIPSPPIFRQRGLMGGRLMLEGVERVLGGVWGQRGQASTSSLRVALVQPPLLSSETSEN